MPAMPLISNRRRDCTDEHVQPWGHLQYHIPEAGSIDPRPPDLHRTPRSVAIALALRHAWLDIVWAQEPVVSCELLQADGQEECKGDDDEYFAAPKLVESSSGVVRYTYLANA